MTEQDANPLGPYLDTPLKLFIADRTLLAQVTAALAILKFSMVTAVAVKRNYFHAMRQLFSEITRFDGTVLVNHPPRKLKDSSGISYEDFSFADFYRGVASFDKSTRRQTSDLLGKCVPVFVSPQDSDIRQRTLEDLFTFGIMGAFMLQVQDLHASQEEQIQERTQELEGYLLEYFSQRDHKVAELKEYKSAEDLRQRRLESEKLMAEVEKLKQAKEFDKAIALCRRAAEVLPTDPGAYLEGGRLLVKKKKYPPAMQMFRDAEKVAEDLPAPNQEIGAMRVAQAKDYIQRKQHNGEPVDQEVVNKFLGEAVENFEAALGKAEQITAVRQEESRARRKDALAAIVENIMTLDLADTVGQQNPFVRQLGKLAHDTLGEKLGVDGKIDPKYVAQFGLMAFFEGDLDTAERYLLQAARLPETFEDACRKLNYIGTQLRRRNQVDDAVRIYKKLLALKPSFRGVALMNLATAVQTTALALQTSGDAKAADRSMEALGLAVEAVYVDPMLPREENFYQNTAIAPTLMMAAKVLRGAVRAAGGKAPPAGDPVCTAACQKLEGLLKAGNDRDALQFMFGLASKLPRFFTGFDKHASKSVMDFAQRLVPLLAGHAAPKMRTFGKILGVLMARGQKAGGGSGLDKRLKPVMDCLERADQAGAARELVRALAANPRLIRDNALGADSSLTNLCRETARKMAGIDFKRFQSG